MVIVVGPASANCKIRISDTAGSPSDESDNTFIISDENHPPSIPQLLTPENLFDWPVGEQYNFTWTSSIDLDGDDVNYFFCSSSDSSYSNTEKESLGSDTSYTPIPPSEGDLGIVAYWWIIASDGIDEARSEIRKIEVVEATQIRDLMQISNSFNLFQNYPNPFNPSTTISFTLPKSAEVTVDIFNSLGQKVKTLMDNQMPAGRHQVKFDAGNLPSGIYFFRIQAGEFQAVKKMLLIR